MTLHQAAAYWIPNIGPHRNQPLANVALGHPDYLVRLAEEGAAECPKGGQFHQAVCLVVERMRTNAEDDILKNRALDASIARESIALLAARNAQLLASAAAAEARKGMGRKTGEGKKGTSAAGAGSAGALFGEM
jgi:hypothetical protein